MGKIGAVILAAGLGKRMKSDVPKVLHEIANKPMLQYVIDAVSPVVDGIIVVIGHKKELLEEYLKSKGIRWSVQEKLAGTGDAVASAYNSLEEYSEVFILPGDTPLVTTDTLKGLKDKFYSSGADLVVGVFSPDDPSGYGRVIMDTNGRVMKIVEDKDATEEQLQIRDVNAGMYMVRTRLLGEIIQRISNNNVQGEYYLTDIVEMLYNEGYSVESYRMKEMEAMGVNNKYELSVACEILRKRKLHELMVDGGVVIVDPQSTFIDMDVKIGRDTVIHPFTFVEGKSVIGERCNIGPMVRVINSNIGDDVLIRENCTLEDSVVRDEAKVGPFAYLRLGVVLKERAFVGKFVEVKNSTIGKGSKVPHLSYIGDATVEEGVNIGAGTITCNYDGKKKNPTVIRKGVFIGSDTMLVAPVEVGEYAYTGAGSVITRDVPPYSLGIARAKQRNVKDWVLRRKNK